MPDGREARTSRRAAALVASTAVLLAALGMRPAPARANEEPAALEPVGSLPVIAGDFATPPGDATRIVSPRALVIDESRNLGFTGGDDARTGATGVRYVVMYDLERLRHLHTLAVPNVPGDVPNLDPNAWAIDAARKRIYMAAPSTSTLDPFAACVGPVGMFPIFVYEYDQDAAGAWSGRLRKIQFPCSGVESFRPLSSSYHAATQSLYMAGFAGRDFYRPQTQFFLQGQENEGSTLLIRQLDAKTEPPTLQWEVDLGDGGCGRRDREYQYVQRVGNDVLAYCFDAYPWWFSNLGQQGYVVRIPLVRGPDGVDRPALVGPQAATDPSTLRTRNAQVRRVPSVPGEATPLGDPGSGRLGLITSDSINGNAVWVFDPPAERFIGVLTGGFASQPPGNTAAGFDSQRGRAYLLTKEGILVAPIRGDLTGGVLTSAVANTANVRFFVNSPRIAVLPGLRRLFVPMTRTFRCPDRDAACSGYLVLRDNLPDPTPSVPDDPDRLTTQVPESPGATAVTSSGRGLAAGAHVVVVGGADRAVAQVDPTCGSLFDPTIWGDSFNDVNSVPAVVYKEATGADQCPTRDVVTPGHREFELAANDVETSTDGGAVGRAAGLAFSSADRATDTDLRKIGECGEHRVRGVTRSGPPSPGDQFEDYRNGCNDFQDGVGALGAPDTREGTHGAGGRGSPIPRAQCGDFGAGAATDRQHPDDDDAIAGKFSTAIVACDARRSLVQGEAASPALALPSVDDPQLVVGRTSSATRSALTNEGRVTIALARAESVSIGPLRIGEVRSLAMSKAKGRTGSAKVSLVRQWCRVSYDGEEVTGGCIDPTTREAQQLVDTLNQVVQKARIAIPAAQMQATPGGFQAVVTKDPAVRAADRAVNDDDSHYVPALQVTWYNDNAQGRSRVVLQLAGVHTESRYGIVELPSFQPPPDPEPTPKVDEPPAPAPEVLEPGTMPPAPITPPTAPVGSPEQFFEEIVRTEVVADTGRDAPPPRLQRQPVAAPRILRVPIEILRDGINLLVQHPREFGLLLVLWSLLSMPFYLGARRRSFARALVG